MGTQRALHTVEFLGSKRRLLPFVVGAIAERAPDARVVADLFSGTGSVAGALKRHGYRVVANDHLGWCSTMTAALLLNDCAPPFGGVQDRLAKGRKGGATGPYERVLRHLNDLPPVRGFIQRNYSPVSRAVEGPGRMYFTERNAGRIDAIRGQIGAWHDLLTTGERALLLADLVRAADAVSNVAGTYGAYLKEWKATARADLSLRPAAFLEGSTSGHVVHCAEAHALAPGLSVDVVYADPPYTKRQYAAYYHVLETIVLADDPPLVGATGLRPWRDKASAFCHRRLAPSALESLVDSVKCRDFFLSYSEDGQITHEEILSILSTRGDTDVLESILPRYRSSRLRHRGKSVRERLYHLFRPDDKAPVAASLP